MTEPLRYIGAFLVPLIVTWIATPIAARLAIRSGLIDHPKEGRFHEGHSTPYLGGLAVAIGLSFIGAAAASAQRELLVIVVCGISVGTMGLIDDWRSVDPRIKVSLEALAGVALWSVGVRAELFGVPGLDLMVTVAWVLVVTNAVNLLDNMDGLSSGVVAISAFTCFLLAAGQGDYLVGSFALAVAGASIGFLRHNFPPATVFLGDAGSLMLGFFLSALALKVDLVGPAEPIRATIVLLIVGIPLFDTLLVVLVRLREGRAVYLGGTDHSSHRLSRKGLSAEAVALVMYVNQIALCGVAIMLVRAPTITIAISMAALLAIMSVLLLLFIQMPHAEELTPENGLVLLPDTQREPARFPREEVTTHENSAVPDWTAGGGGRST